MKKRKKRKKTKRSNAWRINIDEEMTLNCHMRKVINLFAQDIQTCIYDG